MQASEGLHQPGAGGRHQRPASHLAGALHAGNLLREAWPGPSVGSTEVGTGQAGQDPQMTHGNKVSRHVTSGEFAGLWENVF